MGKFKHLVVLDIANSQPFFLGLLAIVHRDNRGFMNHWQRLVDRGDYEVYDFTQEFLDSLSPPPSLLSPNSPVLEPSCSLLSPFCPIVSSSGVLLFLSPLKEAEFEVRGGRGAGISPLRSRFRGENGHKSHEDNEKDNKTRQLGDGTPEKRDNTDVESYLALVKSGKFYETMMEELGQPDDREGFKKRLYQSVFYGTIHAQKDSDEGKVFKKLFPTLFEMLLGLKHGQYQRAARLMQKVESHFIFERICRRIVHERPQIFLGTIHDAIVVTGDQAHYARAVMESEFGKTGHIPKIKDK